MVRLYYRKEAHILFVHCEYMIIGPYTATFHHHSSGGTVVAREIANLKVPRSNRGHCFPFFLLFFLFMGELFHFNRLIKVCKKKRLKVYGINESVTKNF